MNITNTIILYSRYFHIWVIFNISVCYWGNLTLFSNKEKKTRQRCFQEMQKYFKKKKPKTNSNTWVKTQTEVWDLTKVFYLRNRCSDLKKCLEIWQKFGFSFEKSEPDSSGLLPILSKTISVHLYWFNYMTSCKGSYLLQRLFYLFPSITIIMQSL